MKTSEFTGKMIKEDAVNIQDWPEWQLFDALNLLFVEVLAKSQKTEIKTGRMLYPFLDSVSESLESFHLLINRMALRDAYVIGRTIYETAINACFLLTAPNQLYTRAMVHANQKALRNLVRTIRIAGDDLFDFKVPGTDEALRHPMHQEWLKEFTSKSGREITSWTPQNVQERLETIYLQFGRQATTGLAFGLLLYRHASEIAHGTLFGTLFSWGAMEPAMPLQSSRDIGKFRRRELRLLLKLVCFTIESTTRIAASTLDLPNIATAACDARVQYYRERTTTKTKS